MSTRVIALHAALDLAKVPGFFESINNPLDVVQVAELFEDFLNPPEVGTEVYSFDADAFEPSDADLEILEEEIFIEGVLESTEILLEDAFDGAQEDEVVMAFPIVLRIPKEDADMFQQELKDFLEYAADVFGLDFTGIEN